MNRLILLSVVLLIIAVDVWSLYRSDWLSFAFTTVIGVSLLIGLRKSKASQRFQVMLFSVACVIGVIRLAIMLFS